MAGTFLPLTYSNLTPVESAFASPQGCARNGVSVGLGAVSRVANGKCMERMVTNSGMCWGEFNGDDTKFVNRYDYDISGMMGSNRVTSVASAHAPSYSNTVGIFEQQQNQAGFPNASGSSVHPQHSASSGQHVATINPSVVPHFDSPCMVRDAMSCHSAKHYGGCRSYGSYSGCPNCFSSATSFCS